MPAKSRKIAIMGFRAVGKLVACIFKVDSASESISFKLNISFWMIYAS